MDSLHLITNNSWTKMITGITRPTTRITGWRELKIGIPLIQQQKIIDIIKPVEKTFLKFNNCVRIDSFENTKKDVMELIDIIEPIEILQFKIENQISLIESIIPVIEISGNIKPNFSFESSKGTIIKEKVGVNRYYNNSKSISFSSATNNSGDALIVTTRGTLTTHAAFGNWYSTNNIYILRGKGIYSNLINLRRQIPKIQSGSTIPMITKKNIESGIIDFDTEQEKSLKTLFEYQDLLFKIKNKAQATIGDLVKTLLK